MEKNISQALKRVHECVESDDVEGATMVCLRIARYINDYLNAAVFMQELCFGMEDTVRAICDMAPQIEKETQKFIWERSKARWREIHDMGYLLTGRRSKEEDCQVLAVAAGEIESELKCYQAMIDDMTPPQGMHHFDVAKFYHENVGPKVQLRQRMQALNRLKSRIKTRCLNYAILVESHQQPKKINASPLWKLQDSVDAHFKQNSRVVFEKLQKVSVLASSQEGEDCALLLTEVRRTLSAVADMYYPASRDTIVCSDGQVRKLTEDRCLNRLEEYLRTECLSTTSTELVQAELNLLANFMRKLYGLASKGVHADVTQEEAHQGFVGMYLFLSTFIRLAKKTG
ncbi:hypothetical protein [Nitratidesulfovibrio sp. SRB-5]|uniref:hypothetical protein n=1 Tax=Nitratidesulfovibrio sp. SRB-5 TaxID=2872636 RepID=UPI00102636D3|nr:hypothetical protein [Nitratidesulfovibrio sp. SRB-5]MBZ2170634.1 hypothetical protein [Nitratidesulfovibrio sp. SRB-5]RXF75962.1 hypothetical protein EKK70_14235 [Desulfovibrio sp. DS-1]